MPEWVLDQGKSLFASPERDTVVADLEYDSLLDVADGAAWVTRSLRFRGDDVALSVTVSNDVGTGTFAAEALVRPADTFDASALHIDGRTVPAQSNDAGRVSLAGVPDGFVSFYFRSRDGRTPSWRTAWLKF